MFCTQTRVLSGAIRTFDCVTCSIFKHEPIHGKCFLELLWTLMEILRKPKTFGLVWHALVSYNLGDLQGKFFLWNSPSNFSESVFVTKFKYPFNMFGFLWSLSVFDVLGRSLLFRLWECRQPLSCCLMICPLCVNLLILITESRELSSFVRPGLKVYSTSCSCYYALLIMFHFFQ